MRLGGGTGDYVLSFIMRSKTLKELSWLQELAKPWHLNLSTQIMFLQMHALLSLMTVFHFLSVIQSTTHNVWAWQYCTTMKSDLNYTPSNTFETFPFIFDQKFPFKTEFGTIGEKYQKIRSTLMVNANIGLTKTYNLFHKKDLSIEDIIKVSPVGRRNMYVYYKQLY